LKVDILCSDQKHPSWEELARFCEERSFNLTDRAEFLSGGDFLFLVSCTKIIGKELRDLYRHCLVIHESDLPSGRGWSPLAWQVLHGESTIVVSLVEADDPVDSGAIWWKSELELEGHELADEIASKCLKVKMELIDVALRFSAKPEKQMGAVTTYRRRVPEDSELDPHKSIAGQFDLLRICEPRFPAFFVFRDHRYEVTVRKT